MEKLCIASTNEGKICELESILENVFKLYSLKDFKSIPEIQEPYESFLENAQFKAQYYSQFTQILTLSEDAGLEVLALNGFPGIRTHEFIKHSGGLVNAYYRLAELLSDKENYSAQFRCASVLYDPVHGRYYVGEGSMKGSICFPAKGIHGFGFDPIFVPDGYEQTVAELGEVIKTAIGHRGKSIRTLLENYHLGLFL
ncbi:MAG: non-canonical purine NTP pyrophosphatase [Puniceicoccales bacterium]|jgi:XTP/dITP diphosphohydrolase|nr:non-canonical purine NTP pyrophosphatase [Puniceicoccales bacterium]